MDKSRVTMIANRTKQPTKKPRDACKIGAIAGSNHDLHAGFCHVVNVCLYLERSALPVALVKNHFDRLTKAETLVKVPPFLVAKFGSLSHSTTLLPGQLYSISLRSSYQETRGLDTLAEGYQVNIFRFPVLGPV